MDTNRELIREAVFAVLEDLTQIPARAIRGSDRLVADLHLDGDDFSFVFVRGLEKKFRVRTTQEDWDTAFTVDDAIDVFHRRLANIPTS